MWKKREEEEELGMGSKLITSRGTDPHLIDQSTALFSFTVMGFVCVCVHFEMKVSYVFKFGKTIKYYSINTHTLKPDRC